MSRVSAGLLMYRVEDGALQVLLAHPGGPFFRGKDEGSWSIPKGEVGPREELLEAARREFREEVGVEPVGPFLPLTPVKQKGGKTVHAWACQGGIDGAWDPATAASNTFVMEWPPRSGRQAEFPEIDRVEFFGITVARRKINAAQRGLLDELETLLMG